MSSVSYRANDTGWVSNFLDWASVTFAHLTQIITIKLQAFVKSSIILWDLLHATLVDFKAHDVCGETYTYMYTVVTYRIATIT